MGKKVGDPKTGGRQAGTPNAVTKTVRQWIVELISTNYELLERDFKSLDPKDRLVMTEKLMSYILPKPESASEVENAAFTRDDIKKIPLTSFVTEVNGVRKWYDE